MSMTFTDPRYSTARCAGLEVDRASKQERLAGIRADVAKIMAEVQAGKRTITPDLIAKLERLAALERKLTLDVARLTRKIAETV